MTYKRGLAHHSQRRSLEHLGQGLLEAVHVVLNQALLVVEVLRLHQAHERQIAGMRKAKARARGGGGYSKGTSEPKTDKNMKKKKGSHHDLAPT